jgi:hypothetical protein
MSIINDDKAPLNEGRKNKLGKEAQVPLRDQITRKLFDTLVEKGFGKKVDEAWRMSSADMSTFLERQQVYLKDLDEHLESSGEAPFSGSSNLHIPMPFIVSKTYHARFLSAILGVDPPFSIKARREDSVDNVALIEDFMRYTLSDWANYNRGCDETVDRWIWNWVTTGTGIMKVRWDRDFARFMDVETIPFEAPPLEVIGPDGNMVLEQQIRFEEREVMRTIEKFAGPCLSIVQLEDFRMFGGNGDPDLAEMVMERCFMTASDLWSRVDQKIFDEDAVERVIRGGENMKSAADGANIKTQRTQNAGKGSVDNEFDLDKYEVIECYAKVDVDGSGMNSDVIAWVNPNTGELLRATYLQRVIPTGERPYAVAHFHKRQDEEYGLGLLEILHPLSVELDAMHNMRIDFGMITNNPIGFYRASSSLDPETIQMEPGMLLPVDDPQRDIYFPQRPNSTAFGAQEEQAIQSYIERLVGLSDLSYGVQSGTQGATRTASGVRALIGESNSNLDVHLRRLNRAWRKVLRTVWNMTKLRVDPQLVFNVTGDNGENMLRQLTPYSLSMDIDFELSANSANSNKAVQTEVSQQIMSITSNPLYIQLGLVTPNEVYNATKSYLAALGVRDIHRYIKKPQGHSLNLQPDEEFQRVIRGHQVPVTPEMDHAGFIAFGEEMLAQQQKQQTLDEEQIQALIGQMKEHEAMQQALDQQAAQQAVASQMQANAAQSQQQAPAALNPLAGAEPGQLPGG